MKKILLALVIFGSLVTLLFLVPFQTNFMKGDCPFCKDEAIQNQRFYESEQVLGLLTYKPAVPGHALLMPKRHVERFEDLSLQEMNEIQIAIKKLNAAEQKIFGNSGYLLLQKNGNAAGQTVPHLHFHYLPRNEKENHILFFLRLFTSTYFKPQPPEKLKQEAIALQDAMSELLEHSS